MRDCGWIRQNRSAILAFAIGALWLSLQGCSYFRTKPNAANNSKKSSGPGAFQATVGPSGNQYPVPVEVANDIALVMEGKAPARAPSLAAGEQGVAKTVEEGEKVALSPKDDSTAAKEEEDDEKDDEKAANCQCAPGSDSTVTSRKSKHLESGLRHDGKTFTYQVKRGDTLMKISFEKLGNVYRWREIYEANKSSIANFNALVEGTVLKISGQDYVVVMKNGTPYLIRLHDTLGKISREVYGTPKLWQKIWKNNPQLIHDPNKIYAGLTLYYEPLGTSLAQKSPVAPKVSVKRTLQAPVAKTVVAPTPAGPGRSLASPEPAKNLAPPTTTPLTEPVHVQ